MKIVRAYTYDSHTGKAITQRGVLIQNTPQWDNLMRLFYKLGISVLY